MKSPVPSTPISVRPWLLLSVIAAVVGIVGSAIGLGAQQVYDRLTPVFLPQALAQDVVNLVLVGPAILILAALTLRGSRRAYVVWLGALMFTVYNYVIYAFAIPFGSLFPLWVAVLGGSLFALLGGVSLIDRGEFVVAYRTPRAVTVSALALIVIALLFAALWLSEDVPALFGGTTPQTVVDVGTPTNPVHVLDLAFFLPAVLLTAALWLRGELRAGTIGPAFLVFLLLTAIPILATPAVQAVRGDTASWAVAIPIGTISVVCVVLLGWLLATMGPADRLAA